MRLIKIDRITGLAEVVPSEDLPKVLLEISEQIGEPVSMIESRLNNGVRLITLGAIYEVRP